MIEGLTEFLPVSSTGHMILAKPLLGIDDSQAQWSVFLFVSQLGAIGAVVVYFWRDLWRQILHPRYPKLRQHILAKLLIALAPAIVMGTLFNDLMETYLENNRIAVAGALIVGAVVILYIDRRYRRKTSLTIDDVTPLQAFLIGLTQCLSMWPGVSRSAATIMGGMVVGLTPRVAAEFSFYLAIPTMLAAACYRLVAHHDQMTISSLQTIAIGTATAFVVALLVVAAFMRYVRRRSFAPFAYYRIVLGSIVLGWYLLGG